MKEKRQRLTDAERREILNQAILQHQAQGKRLESQVGFHATLVSGKRVDHLLHAFVTFVTGGIWLIVWLFYIAKGGEKREMLAVDEVGRVTITPLKS